MANNSEKAKNDKFFKRYDEVAKKTDKAVRLGKAVGKDMDYFGDSGTQELLTAGHFGRGHGEEGVERASRQADKSIADSVGRGDATRKRLIEKYAKEAPASKMPSSAESAASGDRMSKENAKDAKAVAATTPRKRPSIAASMGSARRVGRQEGDEMRKMGMKHGGAVKKYAKGGVTRADGCAVRGKTKGKIC